MSSNPFQRLNETIQANAQVTSKMELATLMVLNSVSFSKEEFMSLESRDIELLTQKASEFAKEVTRQNAPIFDH